MKNQIKKVGHFLLNHLPFHIRYYNSFIMNKKRIPRLFFPKDYCDYIFRDNFFGRHNKHAYLADKLEVRKFVESKGLANILVPLLGYWDDASKIDFDALPNQFAIKCNHSCGMNIICYDKSKLDIEKTRKQLDNWMRSVHPIYWERHYNHIKPMIIAEALIPSNKDGKFPTDYKIHCAGGTPIFIQCCVERTMEEGSRMVAYDTSWNRTDYIAHTSHYTDKDVPAPKHLADMLNYAALLSSGLDYSRIDFYDTDETVLFGEITLTPQGGLLENFTQDALVMMGSAIKKRIKN